MRKILKVRAQKAKAQNYLCYYCDQPTWTGSKDEFARQFGFTTREAAHFQQTSEHLKPKGDGGSDNPENIVMACRYCNLHRHRKKFPLTPEQYKKLAQTRLAQGKWHGYRNAL